MCSRLGLRTAYIELNGSKQIHHLSAKGDDACFSFLHMDFYPDCTLRSLPEIRKKGYDCLIFDLGLLSPATYQEFVQCKKQFLVGSICPWKSKHTWDGFLKYKIQFLDSEHITLLGNLGIKENITYWKEHYHMKVISVPFLENPFQLTVSDWKFFEEIL